MCWSHALVSFVPFVYGIGETRIPRIAAFYASAPKARRHPSPGHRPGYEVS
jgi:hypothetical protein